MQIMFCLIKVVTGFFSLLVIIYPCYLINTVNLPYVFNQLFEYSIILYYNRNLAVKYARITV